MIANPHKTLTLQYDLSTLKTVLPKLGAYLSENIEVGYIQSQYDDVIGEVHISKTEALSLGVVIVVNLGYKEEKITDVNIEVQRKIGSFNNGTEVTNANLHINNCVKSISALLQNPDWQPSGELKGEALAKEDQQKNLNKFLVGIIIVIIIAAVYLVWDIRSSRA